MLFQDWGGIGRVLLVGALAYASLVAALRISGKRTLAKLNAFDLVVTVALGSTLATILLTSTVSLAEGVTGIVLLVALQYGVASLDVRFALARRLVKSEPVLLLEHGKVLPDALRDQRVTSSELRQAVRAQGRGSLDEVAAVVLETDGSLSVITEAALGPTGSALRGVIGWGGAPTAERPGSGDTEG